MNLFQLITYIDVQSKEALAPIQQIMAIGITQNYKSKVPIIPIVQYWDISWQEYTHIITFLLFIADKVCTKGLGLCVGIKAQSRSLLVPILKI